MRVIALPFVAIVLDVSSWYFTKLYHPFAWVVIFAGGVMGLCFAFMWVVTMYQLWFSPPPSPRSVTASGWTNPRECRSVDDRMQRAVALYPAQDAAATGVARPRSVR